MRKNWLLTVAVLALGTLGLTTTAQAKSVTYSTLTSGSNKTSMASKYFVRPAKVTVKGGRYRVTMHLKTAKTLGKFPVQVVKVNGTKPQNVRKVRDKAGNSNVYYTFTAKNLKKKINAKLSINVLHVYKATHTVTFKFKASQVPKLTRAHTRVVPVATAASQVSAAKKGATLLLP
ncbi:NEAT domain-containing protein [Levilactobacillus zymae]|uniref:NEAT domain-containing protein n=1 Tax=Levilactobacillus zymae TaxID=267363 RepID=UPI0028B81081|nr:NEAT domain-containing protein [Levilactobacillus zymae]MDT6979266.1 NEAT domain-containing protein [Levilactobacillus zymae]